jgi:hypothetical protein
MKEEAINETSAHHINSGNFLLILSVQGVRLGPCLTLNHMVGFENYMVFKANHMV